jgi:hypothetical protein
MEFLSRQTFTSRENVSVWERQTDKIGNDILETLGNVTVCTYSRSINAISVPTTYQPKVYLLERYSRILRSDFLKRRRQPRSEAH